MLQPNRFISKAELILAFMVLSSQASGDWINPPQEEMIQKADLIVLGEFIGRDRINVTEGDGQTTIGVLRVESIYKSDSEKTIVLLKLPEPRPGGMVSSADVVIFDGQRGLWYLTADEKGLYIIDKPYQFISTEYAESHVRKLEESR